MKFIFILMLTWTSLLSAAPVTPADPDMVATEIAKAIAQFGTRKWDDRFKEVLYAAFNRFYPHSAGESNAGYRGYGCGNAGGSGGGETRFEKSANGTLIWEDRGETVMDHYCRLNGSVLEFYHEPAARNESPWVEVINPLKYLDMHDRNETLDRVVIDLAQPHRVQGEHTESVRRTMSALREKDYDLYLNALYNHKFDEQNPQPLPQMKDYSKSSRYDSGSQVVVRRAIKIASKDLFSKTFRTFLESCRENEAFVAHFTKAAAFHGALPAVTRAAELCRFTSRAKKERTSKSADVIILAGDQPTEITDFENRELEANLEAADADAWKLGLRAYAQDQLNKFVQECAADKSGRSFLVFARIIAQSL